MLPDTKSTAYHNDVVIDPCFGSGSTARACQELKRQFYGFEINKEFYRRAKEEMILHGDEWKNTIEQSTVAVAENNSQLYI